MYNGVTECRDFRKEENIAKSPLLVLGFGGNAIDAIDTIENSYEIIGFIDDNPERQKLSFEGIPVYTRQVLEKYKDVKVITLIGSEANFRNRKKIINDFKVPDSRFATIIHPTAVVSRLAKIGHDVIVFAGVIVTANAVIGNHVFILPNSIVHHDVNISDYTMIGANVTIAGHVKVGESCYLGSASSIKNGINIGDRSMIGMAANVVCPVPSNSTMIGNPAKPK
ncbi:MAG: acetyltransferase [Methylobacter sp.]|nr:acetyltransferase [Methylobacter sp.]